jgi:aspartate-semialdehyde dehydrogenase
LAGLGQRRLVATPQASSVLLLTVLKPIAEVAGLERVHVATYQSVSGAGSAAIEELAQQSGQLLNGRAPVKPKFFARQIAFNCLPQVDELQPSGHTRAELALAQDARRILGIPGLGVTATAVYVPVFHGDALAVHIETTRKLNAAETRTLLTKTPGITVFENPSKGGYPTAALDAANQDTVFVGRIREDISQERGLNLWTVSDNTRQGAASNSVRIAEILVRDYL